MTLAPWFVYVNVSFDDKDKIKAIPGSRWDAGVKKWIVPAEMVAYLQKTCQLSVFTPTKKS